MFIDNGLNVNLQKEELILKNMLYVKKYPSRTYFFIDIFQGRKKRVTF